MAELALLALTVLWGTTFALVKDALEFASAPVFLLLRFGVAGLAVGAIALVGRARPTPGVWRHGALLGLALAIGFALQTEGLRHTTPARSAFLTSLYVPLVPILARVLLGRAVASSAWIGITLATLGMAVMARPFDGSLAAPIRLGDALTAAGSIAFALHVLYLSEWSPRHPLSLLTLGQIAIVFAVAAVWAPLGAPRLQADARLWGVVAFTGLCMTAGAFWLMAWAQQRLSAVRAGLIYALEPVAAALFSSVWLGEQLGLADWAGGALIVAGVVVGEVGPSLKLGLAARSD